MKQETRQARHEAIRAAAYRLLAEKGYDSASMLSIAKAAKASNETLYRWYGNKQGLFEAMVRDNATETADMLRAAIKGQDDPFDTLAKVAPVFLAMLLGDRAILLNRAAASEPTGELGAAISAGGRDEIQPLFENLMNDVAEGHSAGAQELTGWFLGLLVGDLQIKRVIGVMPEPSPDVIAARADAALRALSKLLD